MESRGPFWKKKWRIFIETPKTKVTTGGNTIKMMTTKQNLFKVDSATNDLDYAFTDETISFKMADEIPWNFAELRELIIFT